MKLNIKTLLRLFYITLALLIATDFIVPREHIAFPWDRWPGFSSAFGFISCVLIIVVSKKLGKWWLMRKEDYYD